MADVRFSGVQFADLRLSGIYGFQVWNMADLRFSGVDSD